MYQTPSDLLVDEAPIRTKTGHRSLGEFPVGNSQIVGGV